MPFTILYIPLTDRQTAEVKIDRKYFIARLKTKIQFTNFSTPDNDPRAKPTGFNVIVIITNYYVILPYNRYRSVLTKDKS